MKDEDDREAPWTEEQWEQFMRDADMRAARYGELMETLIEHPQRDDIIDREMGWDRKDSADRDWLKELENAAIEDPDEELEDDDPEPDREGSGISQSDQLDEMLEEEERELRAIPAYIHCEAASTLIDKTISPLLDKLDHDDYDLTQAFIQIKMAMAKIVGGHGMGYEDEVLGGNVVNCKRSLAATIECATAIEHLINRKLVDQTEGATLLAAVAAARQAVESRIVELRSRMWWQKPLP